MVSYMLCKESGMYGGSCLVADEQYLFSQTRQAISKITLKLNYAYVHVTYLHVTCMHPPSFQILFLQEGQVLTFTASQMSIHKEDLTGRKRKKMGDNEREK